VRRAKALCSTAPAAECGAVDPAIRRSGDPAIRRSGDPAIKADLTIEQLQDFLVTIAPVVGTARVMSTAGHIAQAFGIAAPALAETEAEAIANAEAQSRSKS
jgi:hypothetical protein